METISNWFMFLLVNSIWQITAIALISLVCDRLLRKMPARVRHGLWVAALVFAVVSPLLSGVDPNTVLAPNMEVALSNNVQATHATFAPLDENAPTAQPLVQVSETFALSFLGVYLLVVGYRALRLIGAFRKTSQICQSSFAGDQSESLSKVIEDCKIAYGVKNVKILCSRTVSSPVTLGAFRPTVVLPASLLDEADHNILLTAVSHELNHVRRHDYILNLLYELIYLPISFHPAATLVKRRIKETRELACDEYVTDTMVEPAVYARSLVSIAGLAMDLGRGANITIGIMDDDDLEKRIMKILNRSKITTFRRNVLLGSSAFLLALFIVAAMSFSLTPVIAQQKNASDSETDRSKKEADERLKKLVEELRIKKVKQALEPQQSEGDGDSVTIGYSTAVGDGDSVGVGVSTTEVEEFAAKREAELKSELLKHLILANPPKLAMADAINIATGQQPGTVVESRLVFERNGGETEEPFYVIKVAFDQNGLKTEKKVIVSGTDGSVGGPRNN